MYTGNIDWSEHAKFPEREIECRCGTYFMSHTKLVPNAATLILVTQKNCPSCGTNDNAREARQVDWEPMTINKEDEGKL